MLELITGLSVLAVIIILLILSYIDIKEFLLPNELVLGVAVTGLIFHVSTMFIYSSFEDLLLGAFIGGGSLFLVRGVASHFYGEDALGLGDVKLLAAGGLWLGAEHILIAITLGALAGFVHGLGVAIYTQTKSKVKIDINRLSIPAGPGFAAGLFLTGLAKFVSLPTILSLWTIFLTFLTTAL